MKINSILLLALLAVFTTLKAETFQFTRPEDCSTIRLDQTEPLNKIAVTDMGELSMCGAFATSTLVDAFLLTQNQSHQGQIAPVYLGVQFAAMKNYKSLEISDPIDLASNLNGMNFCPYAKIKNEKAVSRLLVNLDSGFSSKDVNSIKQYLLNSDYFQSPNIDVKSLRTLLNENASSVKFIKNVFDEVCKGELRPLNGLPSIEPVPENRT